MPRFISLLDDTGRTSSLLVTPKGLQVVGVLPHGSTIAPRNEYATRHLINWLSARLPRKTIGEAALEYEAAGNELKEHLSDAIAELETEEATHPDESDAADRCADRSGELQDVADAIEQAEMALGELDLHVE